MLDIHTHMLPKMDDGSRSAAESVRMIRESVAQGVDTIALTSHFYPGREAPDAFLKRREKSANRLAAALEGKKNLPRILLGAEVAYFEGIGRAERLEELCIGKTGVLLVEMPFCKWNSRMLKELMELKDARDVRPMLAHVERYIGYQERGLVSDLCDAGIMMQVNASWFLRWNTSWKAMRMLRSHQIHALGSDCHNMRSREPNLILAYDKIQSKRDGKDLLKYLRRKEKQILEERR